MLLSEGVASVPPLLIEASIVAVGDDGDDSEGVDGCETVCKGAPEEKFPVLLTGKVSEMFATGDITGEHTGDIAGDIAGEPAGDIADVAFFSTGCGAVVALSSRTPLVTKVVDSNVFDVLVTALGTPIGTTEATMDAPIGMPGDVTEGMVVRRKKGVVVRTLEGNAVDAMTGGENKS
jgi:hypothetical protein